MISEKELLYYKKKFDSFSNLVYKNINPKNKTVVFFSHFQNYNSYHGNLHQIFKKANWNVINLKTQFVDDANFEKKAPTFTVPNFTKYGIWQLKLEFVDLVISANSTDKNAISSNAKGLYLSHDLFSGVIPSDGTKYVFLGSKQAIKHLINGNHSYNIKNLYKF